MRVTLNNHKIRDSQVNFRDINLFSKEAETIMNLFHLLWCTWLPLQEGNGFAGGGTRLIKILTVWPGTCSRIVQWRSFYRAPPVLPHNNKKMISVQLLHWYPFYCSVQLSLSNCPSPSIHPSPYSWDRAWRHGKPSCNSEYECAILEELDCLCSRRCFVSLAVTQVKNVTPEKDL